MALRLDARNILDSKPDPAWWAALVTHMLHNHLITHEELLDRDRHDLHESLIHLFVARVLDGTVDRPEFYLVTPWAFWFVQDNRGQISRDRWMQLIETGAGALEKPPEDFAALSAALSAPGKPPVTWPMLRSWLFYRTDRAFLKEFLRRRGFMYTSHEPKRTLWIRMQMIVTQRIYTRDDLKFLGLNLPANPAVDFRKQFRDYVKDVERDVSRVDYPHYQSPPSDDEVALETGEVAILKKLGPEHAARVAYLESLLDARYLKSWLVQHTQQSEASFEQFPRAKLYAWYLRLQQCNDAPDFLSGEFDRTQLLRWLSVQHALVHEENIDLPSLVQRFCQVQQTLEHKIEHSDFSGLSERKEAFKMLARHHFHAQDPAYLDTALLVQLANKVAKTDNPDMSRTAAHAVLNLMISSSVSDREFFDIARERAYPASLTLESARNFVLASNTRRMVFFAHGKCLPTNLERDSQRLDLVRDPDLSERALGESLMRQYLNLLALYGSCRIDRRDATVEDNVREFVLSQFFTNFT